MVSITADLTRTDVDLFDGIHNGRWRWTNNKQSEKCKRKRLTASDSLSRGDM